MMRAYKFLDRDQRSPFTLTAWESGSWVEVDAVQPCGAGVHACRPGDLSFWLHDALWEIELDGDVRDARHKVVAPRGRLLAPIDGYPAAVRELAEAGAWRCRDRAARLARAGALDALADHLDRCTNLEELADSGQEIAGLVDPDSHAGVAAPLAADAAHFALHGRPAQSPFVDCCSAGHEAAGPNGDQVAYNAGYTEERRFQSAWLGERLGLTG
jgi:hypothetical protein